MLQILLVALAGAQLASAQHVHKYHKFPVAAGHETECYDAQVGKYFNVGETWALTNNACKQSQCIKDGNDLFIDRISCDPVKDLVELLKKQEKDVLCREAAGNRRKPFPGCCASPLCKKRVGGRLRSIPKSEYPELPDQVTYETA